MTKRHFSALRSWCAGLALLGLIAALPFAGWAFTAQDKKTEGKEPKSAVTGQVQPTETLGKEWLQTLKWRSIGPANMGGRITAISVYENDPTIYYVATASGGLLKTVNNGITFEHLFDREATVSIGDVCVAPSNPDIVWVGTGESNPRNSVSYGDGVYKSTDGGKSWKNMGLKKTFQIGKILIHPTNPDIVYVGALGRLYGSNKERGLYKTTDGGKTWKQIHFVNENTGVIDMRMHPAHPDTLIVATYQRQRDGHDFNDPAVKWGKGSGLYKTTDGGQTFVKITKGLPTGTLGRIGLDWYRKDPKVLYMVLESDKIGMAPKGVKVKDAYIGILGEDAPEGARLTRIVEAGPAEKAGLKINDIVLEMDKKKVKSYQDWIQQVRNYKSGDKVELKIKRGNMEKKIQLTFGSRSDATKGLPLTAHLGGQKENMQQVQGKDGYQYGGVYRSDDGGESWVRVNSLNPRPMYFSQIRVDPSDDKYVYVLGISLHRSKDGGKKFTPDGGKGVHADQHALWINPKDGRHMIVGTDGGFYVTHDRMAHWDHLNNFALGQFYHVAVDPRPNYKVYGGLQDNGTWGGLSFTNSVTGPVNADWFRVSGADGFRCVVDPKEPDLVYFCTQNGNLGRRNLLTGEVASVKPQQKGEAKYRWNWNTPFMLSHHKHKVYYCGAQFVFKSLDRGKNPQIISPDLTRTKLGSLFALAESPKNPDVLYAGSDDGFLWISRDGGKNWTNITKNVTGLMGPRWVASIEASRFAEGRAYVVFDGHRSNDNDPYVFVTEDFGQTWKSLRNNLPWGSTRVLREDIENPNVLYLGTEFGTWCTLDRGQNWIRLNTNLPTVAVHEFAQHPTAGEMVAATHGRSLWVLDVSGLRQMDPATLNNKVQFYKPAPAVQWVPQPSRGTTNRGFVGQNKPVGAPLYYSLPKDVNKISITVLDDKGKTVRQLKGSTKAGLNKVLWTLSRQTTMGGKGGGGKGGPGGGGKGGPGGGGKGKGFGFSRVPAGSYQVVLNVDGQEFNHLVQVLADPGLPSSVAIAESLEDELEEEEENDWTD